MYDFNIEGRGAVVFFDFEWYKVFGNITSCEALAEVKRALQGKTISVAEISLDVWAEFFRQPLLERGSGMRRISHLN